MLSQIEPSLPAELPSYQTYTPVTIVQPKKGNFNFLFLLIPLALIAGILYVVSHHNSTTVVSQPTLPSYVSLNPNPSMVNPLNVSPGAINPSKTTLVQSTLSDDPAAHASVRGGLSTDPGLAQYTTTVNPNCLPGTQYYPACTFTNPRSSDYNPNPQCYKGSKYYPLCLVTSVHTNPSWR